MKPNGGFEPPTAALQVQRSTTELIKLTPCSEGESEAHRYLDHALAVYKMSMVMGMQALRRTTWEKAVRCALGPAAAGERWRSES